MLTPRTDHLIDLALEEDAGLGDVTSRAIFPARHRSRAVIDAKQDLVICGLEVAARVFSRLISSPNLPSRCRRCLSATSELVAVIYSRFLLAPSVH